MNGLDERINESLDILIENETLLGHELQLLLKSFKEEKTTRGFSFGKLCFWHYEAFSDGVNEDIYKVAAAIELLILSFDIIDDIQDKDSDYIWSKTPELSLNVALAMLIMASKAIDDTSFEHKQVAIRLLEKYALQSINGQQLDLLNNCRDEESYVQMITQKSGSLTAMGCLIGEVLAKGEVSKEVEEYGKYIGIIQQIKNDIQGLKVWGPKNDLLNKKYSLPIIYLLTKKNDISNSVASYYNDDIVTVLDQNATENELTNSGAIRYAITIKNVYKFKALNYLENVEINELGKIYLQELMK
ncbi:MAG TPA: transcriptional regulator [Lysinibacillus sp.]|uniref:Transcriptional regulator n=1 Tax=Lysinibacillus fusiformis TaxID=28031 RepID=A0A2I0UWZ7_9BACI|nr:MULTISPECIES: polyprenyl synthetase family protein [Lysinibacillus]HBT70961.1 transcriptional regulator [Lysinibacillus sp.]KUF31089.1 transcriptional regulator [Lysinibacillus sp. F5]PKU50584.1 transcriptional regulator [Lysinibacillus fusiformis]WCH47454.1 polyprenyl synthetase family protein [Lysinibacillus sp. OF-1]SCZ00859.1 competence protein ComQ [Lysinibacillus sp. SG9]